MKRDKSDNNKDQDKDQVDTLNEADKRPKFDSSLDLKDLGAGYDAEDRKVVRAIELYQTKLLPFIEENQSIFKKSNFLALKGYAAGLSSADENPTSSNH
jgi:hypothetical protein